MTTFDLIVVLVIALSVVVGVLRGAVKEVLSLAGWIAAIWVANSQAQRAAQWLPGNLSSPTLRLIAAYVTLFIATLLLATLLRFLVQRLVKALNLSAIDRVFGVCIGLARGILIVLLGVLVSGMTPLPREEAWRHAMSSKWFETLAIAVKPLLPDDIARRIRFSGSRTAHAGE